MNVIEQDRRRMLSGTGMLALSSLMGTAPAVAQATAPSHKFRGVYPIARTPVDGNGKLDVAALGRQVSFCERRGVAGIVWPQLASGWASLSEEQRFAGAEGLLSAAKNTSVNVVIGLQARDDDLALARRFADHAARNGAFGVISLPPQKSADHEIVEYYKTIGEETSLPLVVQTVGNMSTDLVGKIFQAVPSLACVKEEAGNPLDRVAEIRRLTNNRVAVFAGKGAHTFLSELHLNFDGSCPFVSFADLLQRAFNLWHAGNRKDAFDLISRFDAIMTIPRAEPYISYLRKLIPDSDRVLTLPDEKDTVSLLSADDKHFISDVYQRYLAPALGD